MTVCVLWLSPREEHRAAMPPPRASACSPEAGPLGALCALVHDEHPVPAPVPQGPSVPTRAVPCLPGAGPFTLRAVDGDPVVCGEAICLRLDLAGGTASFVARPAAAPAPPTSAEVRQVGGHWSACRGATCKQVGPRLASALAATTDAGATLDLRTVVVADQIWDVAGDRTVTLRRPDFNPRGPEHHVAVVGDLLLVQWEGGCTDSACLGSQLVDRTGRVVDSVEAGGRLLAIDDRRFLTISEFSRIEVRDLHTGAKLSSFDPLAMAGDFVDVARLYATNYALLRQIGDGVEVTAFEIGDFQLAFGSKMQLPSCD